VTGAAVTDVISCEQSSIIDQWTLAVKSTFAVDFSSLVGAASAAKNQPYIHKWILDGKSTFVVDMFVPKGTPTKGEVLL
jgi:hypothetical protein